MNQSIGGEMSAGLKAQPRPNADLDAVRSYVAPWLVVLLWPVHWILTRVYLRVRVVHAERVPRRGPVLLVPTHRSRWDPVVLYCATRRPLRYMTSHDEFVGAQGWVMRRLGAFPVNTRRPSASVFRHAREVLAAGKPLAVFPEGTIFYYPPHQVHPIKPGAAWLALDCQEHLPGVPLAIVPIRIVYSDRYPRLGTRVELVVQEPIALGPYLDPPRKEAIHRLTAELQRSMGDEVNASLAEMSPPRTTGPASPDRAPA
jgi:1-acyl-sn-glycerol-3-phosphate acyltransferase